MIVELTPNDITRLSLGEDVEVGGVIVRMGATLIESIANGVESLPPAKPSRACVFTMMAKFNGRCYACKGFVRAGGPVIRDVQDASNKRTLCMTCGEPVLADYERKSQTGV